MDPRLIPDRLDLQILDDCRRILLPVAAVFGAALVVACSDAKPVSFYLDHPTERATKVEQCLAQALDSADCANAKQAAFQAYGIRAVDGRAVTQ